VITTLKVPYIGTFLRLLIKSELLNYHSM